MYLENKKIRTYFPYNIKCTNEFFRTSSESYYREFISLIVTIFFCTKNSAVVRQTSRFCIFVIENMSISIINSTSTLFL